MTQDDLVTSGRELSPLQKLESWRQAWLTLDKNERAISFVQTRKGMAILHLAFFIVIFLNFRVTIASAVLSIIALCLCAAFPARRLYILSALGLVSVVLRPFYSELHKTAFQSVASRGGITDTLSLQLVISVAALLFVFEMWALLAVQSRYRESFIGRRPIVVLLALFAVTLLSVSFLPLEDVWLAGAWAFVIVNSSLFWFAAYALSDNKMKDKTPNALRPGFFRPVWGGSPTPIGKGPAFLRKFEAKDDAELAITRIKGLKIGAWGAILGFVYSGWKWFSETQLGIPPLLQVLQAEFGGNPVPLWVAWCSVISNYFVNIIMICTIYHIVVGIVRMAGYRIPRNTVRPLAARTLAEFWNRYYYYFKELLVDLFFYPAFLRYFKKQPKLRLAFATFCAAGMGNFIYHFTRDIGVAAETDLLSALPRFQTYAFYCTVLAAGIIISQLRTRKPTAEDGFVRYEILPRLNVGAFFCLLGIFDTTIFLNRVEATFWMHIEFLFRLFGVDL